MDLVIVVVLLLAFNNKLLLQWGTNNFTGRKTFILPTTYTTAFIPIASINAWTPNNSYSVTCCAVGISKIEIDHWYGSGASLSGACSYVTIGF